MTILKARKPVCSRKLKAEKPRLFLRKGKLVGRSGNTINTFTGMKDGPVVILARDDYVALYEAWEFLYE